MPQNFNNRHSLLPVLSFRNPEMKKRLATARFQFQHVKTMATTTKMTTITTMLVVCALIFLSILFFLFNMYTIRPSKTTIKEDSFIDPCYQVTPQPLRHFDPAIHMSREFLGSDMKSDKDPPGFNRIFSTFFDRYLFTLHSDVVIGINSTARGRQTDIKNGLTIAEHALRQFHDTPSLKVDNYSIGYEHLDRVRGARQIFHLYTSSHGRQVVSIQRLFDGQCFVSVRTIPDALYNDDFVYIILPYSSRPKRLAWFLQQFEELVLESEVRTKLIISVFKQNVTDVTYVNQLVHESQAKQYVMVIPVSGDRTMFFSRAIAIRDASKLVPLNSIMFISDVDMYIFASMFDSCRNNVIQGSQVYFPVFYSLFPRNDRIERSGGYWRESSMGMSCMYRSDFDTVKAYDENAESKFIGWGMEDRALHQAFQQEEHDEKYQVFRAIEPALRHKWHVKHCEKMTSFYEDCLSITFMQLGDMKGVGKYLFDSHALDTQKLFVKFAQDDDDDDGRIVVDNNNSEEGNKKNRDELDRIEKRRELLRRNSEARKRREEQRKQLRERQWRRENGIRLEGDEDGDGNFGDDRSEGKKLQPIKQPNNL